jgi:outer membrane lipoprotein carrier protein
MNYFYIILLAISLVVPRFAIAFVPETVPAVDDILAKVEAVYVSSQTFESDFIQTYIGRNFGDIESKGEVYFKKPGMMKWLYKKPGKKTIVADGSQLWVYDEADSQVILDKNFKKENVPSSISFLWGEKMIRNVFKSRLLSTEGIGGKTFYVVELVPKGEVTNIAKIHFLIDGSNFRIAETTLFDLFGNENRLVFKNIRLGKKLDDKFFQFKPPKGIIIVEPPTLKP